MRSPVAYLLSALALCGCAASRVKEPVRISDRITLVEGYRRGTLQYAEDEMKEAKLEKKKSLLDHLNPEYRDTSLNIYEGSRTRRLYFDNGGGGQVYLMRIVRDGKTIQECDEPEYKEGLTGGGGGWVSAGPGKPMTYIGGGKQEVEVRPVHDIRCILKQHPDTIGVELMDPEGLFARYQVILKHRGPQ